MNLSVSRLSIKRQRKQSHKSSDLVSYRTVAYVFQVSAYKCAKFAGLNVIFPIGKPKKKSNLKDIWFEN